MICLSQRIICETHPSGRRKANTTVQCPVQPGEYEVQHTVSLPKEIPQGMSSNCCVFLWPLLSCDYTAKFTVDVRGYTAEENDLMCLALKVNFMRNPFPHFGW